MALAPPKPPGIPAETVRIARRAFPKGSPYMRLRDELGPVYTDEAFAQLFSWKGEIAQAPGLLALVCVMQYMEGLSDRQAAEAVRARIDWKYALGLAIDDAGFDASVLSRFRQRLLDGGTEGEILERILRLAHDKQLVKPRGRQRTDATHVLGAVRDLNRLELVGETLRQALEVLAGAVPAWLQGWVPAEWFDRYGRRIEQARLPKSTRAQTDLRLTIGADGYQLLRTLYADETLQSLWDHPAIEALRQIWVQQFYLEDDQVHWRQARNLPSGSRMLQSPYDLEVRYGQKRQMSWKGYKVHLTESCDTERPHLIVHVETTPATTPDCEVVDPIHQALADKGLLPAEQLLDGGYMDADNLVECRQRHQVTLVGPVADDPSWQAQEQKGFALSDFSIDWAHQQARCPQGQTSRSWSTATDSTHNPVIHIGFAPRDCQACPSRESCTRSSKGARTLTLRHQAQHEALQKARRHQQTEAFRQRYQARAGVEGTVSQGVRAYDLRRTRFIGLAKTHLHHLLSAAAINLVRLADWFEACQRQVPLAARRATTRTSRLAALAPS